MRCLKYFNIVNVLNLQRKTKLSTQKVMKNLALEIFNIKCTTTNKHSKTKFVYDYFLTTRKINKLPNNLIRYFWHFL